MKLEVFHCLPHSKPADHVPILFVHGAYCAGWIWSERFMPYLAEQGFPCHALSLRGHGGSEGSLTWASLADYVDDVMTVASDLGGPLVLAGHSMGGLVVQHALSRYQPKAAVLMSSVPPSGLASSAMHLSMFAPDVMWQLGLLQSLGHDAVSPEVIYRAFVTPATRSESVAHLMKRMQRESHRISAELLAPSQPIPPTGSNRPPVLVMGGDADVFLPVSAFRETATYFQGELEVMAGAPHGMMLDDVWWKTAADKLMAWLKAKKL